MIAQFGAEVRIAAVDGLVARGLRGVEFIVSDDHAGLRAARRAVFGAAIWQRCQFHLAQNAIHHASGREIRERIGAELRQVWNAETADQAQKRPNDLVAAYRAKTPNLADWLEKNIPEGLAVFAIPEPHRRKMRTSNPIERAVQQELMTSINLVSFGGLADFCRQRLLAVALVGDFRVLPPPGTLD